MHCPKCKTTALRPLSEAAAPLLSGLPPHCCPDCRGVWVGLETATGLLEPRMLGDRPAATLPGRPEADRRTGLCPEGHGILLRLRFEADPIFYVEYCRNCRGVWFDAGEWQRLAELGLMTRLGEVFHGDWSRDLQAELQSSRELERLHRLFGPELVGRLKALAEELRSHPRRSAAMAFLQEEILRRKG